MELERKAVLRAAPAHTVHYERRRPEETILHCLVREHLETFLAQVQAKTGTGLPEFVKDEFEAFLECGILAHGFLRLRCADCAHEKLVAFSCPPRGLPSGRPPRGLPSGRKRGGFCPSCGARRMAESAAVLVDEIIPRLLKLLTRLGYLVEEQGMTYLADIDPDNALTPLQAASCGYRIALGPRAGQKVLSLRPVPGRDEKATAGLCADALGFSLHAWVRCGAHQRKELERLCRYIRRPAIAFERLKRDGAGNVVLQLKSPWREGTTHIVMSPLEFMQPLAALVPRPRLHLIRFHGVLAPNAGLRAAIVPGPPQNTSEPAGEHAHGAPARMGWARLLRRVFDLDLEHCPQCGGNMKIIAAVEEPAVIVGILTHLGLPARAPPHSPAWPALARSGQTASE